MREDREQQSSRQGRRGGGGGQQSNGGGGGGGGGANIAGRQLYVGNLSFETTWADLKDHFRAAGEVERADVMMDSSRRSKGWGTVRFSTPVRFPFFCVLGGRGGGAMVSDGEGEGFGCCCCCRLVVVWRASLLLAGGLLLIVRAGEPGG